MKESVLDVLMYMFESYMDEEDEYEIGRAALQSRLLDAGFEDNEIGKAFDWLDGLPGQLEGSDLVKPTPHTFRMYHSSEVERLNRECRGFLLFLEQLGILDTVTRELVIDRIMALEDEEVDLEHLKWVTLMVLFNLPGGETTFDWLEELVLQEVPQYIH